MSVNTLDLKMTGLDSLFSNDEARAEYQLPHIVDIPLSEIDDFPDHPFQVRDDEDMQELVQSVKERGVITPIILRPKEDGRYEIVSGHRRRKACRDNLYPFKYPLNSLVHDIIQNVRRIPGLTVALIPFPGFSVTHIANPFYHAVAVGLTQILLAAGGKG